MAAGRGAGLGEAASVQRGPAGKCHEALPLRSSGNDRNVSPASFARGSSIARVRLARLWIVCSLLAAAACE
jgi:hypothetical protein